MLTVDSSTIADNFGADGAGIYTVSTTNIKSSTLSGNISRGNNTNGGGILVVNGAIVTITSSTIVGNAAQLSGGGLATGAGQIKLRNTIVARNTAIGAPFPDLSGNVTSNGYNFIGNSKGGSIVATTGDQVGSEAAPIDPLLGPLQDNGGPTLTRAPCPEARSSRRGIRAALLPISAAWLVRWTVLPSQTRRAAMAPISAHTSCKRMYSLVAQPSTELSPTTPTPVPTRCVISSQRTARAPRLPLPPV